MLIIFPERWEKIAMINMFKKLDDTMEKSQQKTGNFFFFKEPNGNARTETMNKIGFCLTVDHKQVNQNTAQKIKAQKEKIGFKITERALEIHVRQQKHLTCNQRPRK